MKGVQCYELFGGIALKIHTFSFFIFKVGMHKGSVLSPFLFAVVVDVVTEYAKQVALSEPLYAHDLIMMSETIEGI